MAYDKEALFPTRTGDSQGAGAERVMLDSLGGAAGVRTKVAPTPDGGEVLLRTRGGSPEFQSTSSHQVECLLGPLVEQDSMYAQRTWRTPLETDTPLVSSDGLITFWRTPLTKWVAQSKNKRVFELHFSSRFALPGDPAEPPSGNKIIEESWSNRTWHPAQIAQVVTSTLPLLHFVVTRMRSLALRWKRLKAFTWRFNTDGDPALVGNPPACMAQSGQEMGLSTRTAYAHGALQQLSLLILNHKGVLQTASPGGWLGALEGPPSVGDDPIELATMAGSNITPLSEATYFGQPWHGWMGTGGIDTLLGAHVLPAGYSFGGSNAAAYNEAGYETHYVAIPDLPAVPTGRLPDDPAGFPAEYDTQHMQFLTDAVLFGTTKRYSPQSSFSLGRNRWFHWNVSTGVRILRLDITYYAGTSSMELRLFDDGQLTLWGVKGTPKQIGGHETIHPFYQNYAWSGQVKRDFYNASYPKFRWVPLNTSPTGDRFLFQAAYNVSVPISGGISFVWEGYIQDDLSGWTLTKVWDWQDHMADRFGQVAISATFALGALIGVEVLSEYVSYNVYELLLNAYDLHFRSMEPDIETYCVNATYTPGGDRRLTKIELTLNKEGINFPKEPVVVGTWRIPVQDVEQVLHDPVTLHGVSWFGPTDVRIIDPDVTVLAGATLPLARQAYRLLDDLGGSTNFIFAVNYTSDELAVEFSYIDFIVPISIQSEGPALNGVGYIQGSNVVSLAVCIDYSTKEPNVWSTVCANPLTAVPIEQVRGISVDLIEKMKHTVLQQTPPWVYTAPPHTPVWSAAIEDIVFGVVSANSDYTLGYYAFDPRSGEVRGSLLPDIGYL